MFSRYVGLPVKLYGVKSVSESVGSSYCAIITKPKSRTFLSKRYRLKKMVNDSSSLLFKVGF